jgi:DNA-directed RNA polymerase specialized sigma24 family protein
VVARVDGQQSFEEYVHARNAALSRIAYLLTGDHHLAEDLVQATLLRVVGRWAGLVAAGDPDPYVRRVLYDLHVSWWRRREAPVAPHEWPASVSRGQAPHLVAGRPPAHSARIGPAQAL